MLSCSTNCMSYGYACCCYSGGNLDICLLLQMGPLLSFYFFKLYAALMLAVADLLFASWILLLLLWLALLSCCFFKLDAANCFFYLASYLLLHAVVAWMVCVLAL